MRKQGVLRQVDRAVANFRVARSFTISARQPDDGIDSFHAMAAGCFRVHFRQNEAASKKMVLSRLLKSCATPGHYT